MITTCNFYIVLLLNITSYLSFIFQFFADHPTITLVDYCTNPDVSSFLHNWTTVREEGFEPENVTLFSSNDTSPAKLAPPSPFGDEPNTAFKSFILQFGTFWIAYYLRIFRNGKALGRTVKANSFN